MHSALTFPDGRVLKVRAIGPQDAAAVQAFVRALSHRSKLQRFFSPIMELTPRQLERAVGGAGLHLAALDAAGVIVALAQYAPEGPREAEFGVVVADPWQRHGIGERLLQRLMEEARRSGIARMAGVTQSDNDPMRMLARKLGFAFRADPDPRLVRMERALPI